MGSANFAVKSPSVPLFSKGEVSLQDSTPLWVELAALRQSLDGRDLFACRIGGEHETRAHRPAIDQHSARTAHADAAALDRTFEREIVAQALQQCLIGSNRKVLWRPVDCR